MTDRWVPKPAPGDGPDGRGESGPAEALESREETEEAAETGRFPDDGDVVDRSNPIEPDAADQPRH